MEKAYIRISEISSQVNMIIDDYITPIQRKNNKKLLKDIEHIVSQEKNGEIKKEKAIHEIQMLNFDSDINYFMEILPHSYKIQKLREEVKKIEIDTINSEKIKNLKKMLTFLQEF
ncbi:hypothetical protein KY314_01435 [Candidatus Woesearchaeota archaeon]|nr:hypothetical protein [Candidatus Woesearchaeota archaeon]